MPLDVWQPYFVACNGALASSRGREARCRPCRFGNTPCELEIRPILQSLFGLTIVIQVYRVTQVTDHPRCGRKEMSEATIPIQAAAPPRLSEDLVAVGLGLGVFVLALLLLLGADALGWLVTTSVWTHPSTALAPATKAYASLGGLGSLLVSYVVLTAVLSASLARRRRQAIRARLHGGLCDRLCELVRRRLCAIEGTADAQTRFARCDKRS